jgi:uncharacterized protein
MSEDLKYLADASLAKLAKWLRLLGYDTVVFSRKAGREMLRLAAAEKRIVLTRRYDMQERQFSGKVYLMKGREVGSQLREVIDQFHLVIDHKRMFRICLKCNKRLSPLAKETVRDLVPPYVFANYSEYNQCPQCRNIYWAGTHQRNSFQFLENLSIIPEKYV